MLPNFRDLVFFPRQLAEEAISQRAAKQQHPRWRDKCASEKDERCSGLENALRTIAPRQSTRSSFIHDHLAVFPVDGPGLQDIRPPKDGFGWPAEKKAFRAAQDWPVDQPARDVLQAIDPMRGGVSCRIGDAWRCAEIHVGTAGCEQVHPVCALHHPGGVCVPGTLTPKPPKSAPACGWQRPPATASPAPRPEHRQPWPAPRRNSGQRG